jgi:hypothetical protein
VDGVSGPAHGKTKTEEYVGIVLKLL